MISTRQDFEENQLERGRVRPYGSENPEVRTGTASTQAGEAERTVNAGRGSKAFTAAEVAGRTVGWGVGSSSLAAVDGKSVPHFRARSLDDLKARVGAGRRGYVPVPGFAVGSPAQTRIRDVLSVVASSSSSILPSAPSEISRVEGHSPEVSI